MTVSRLSLSSQPHVAAPPATVAGLAPLRAARAANQLGVVVDTLRSWSRVGVIPYVSFGVRPERRYRQEDIDELLAARSERRQTVFAPGALQTTPEGNPLVLCACGCGESFPRFDGKGRSRWFLSGHQNRLHRPKVIETYEWPTEKNCSACHTAHPIDRFGVRVMRSKVTGQSYLRPRSLCREAENTRGKAAAKRHRIASYGKVNPRQHPPSIRRHVQERLSGWRKKTPGSDLTTDYLVELWEAQDGRCHYTALPMTFEPGRRYARPDSASLDRLDPAGGYMRGNVVWATCLANTMKRDLVESDFYATIERILTRRNARSSAPQTVPPPLVNVS